MDLHPSPFTRVLLLKLFNVDIDFIEETETIRRKYGYTLTIRATNVLVSTLFFFFFSYSMHGLSVPKVTSTCPMDPVSSST